jgi:hypothetical protein
VSSQTRLSAQICFRVEPSAHTEIEKIAEAEHRKPNEVARALLERGAAAYLRDGHLFEPEADWPDSIGGQTSGE